MTAELLRILGISTAASCAALLLVLVSRKSMRQWFGARVAYALWVFVPLAAVIALLPPPVASFTPSAMKVLSVPVTFAAAPIVAPIAPSFDPTPLLLALWIAGALIVLFLFVRQQRNFVRMLGRLSKIGNDTLRAETTAGCPALIGALRPRVVVPSDFEQRYSPTERDLILTHERTHRVNGDAQINLIAAAVRCVFWFNPLVHFAASRFRFDQELACDASVISRFPEARRSYADAMLKTQLADFGLPVGCHWQSSHPLKERIAMLKQPLPSLARKALGTGIAAALVFGGVYAAWATQPAQLAADRSDIPGAISAELVLNIDGKPVDGWNSHTDHLLFMHHDGKTDPSKWEVRVAANQPFAVAINKGSEKWQIDATAKPLADNTLEFSSQLRHNGDVVSSPRLIVRDGQAADIRIGEEDANGVFKGFGASITLARADKSGSPQMTKVANTTASDASDSKASYRGMKRIDYPSAALANKVEGVVYVKAHIGVDGKVVSAAADHIDPSSATALADTAIDGIKSWTFNPAQKGGKATQSDEIIPIVFSLSPGRSPPVTGGTLDAIRVAPPAERKAAAAEVGAAKDFTYRNMSPPVYPQAAIDKHQQGRLVFKVLIDEHGAPLSVEVEHSDPPEAAQVFAQSGKDAIMTWKFNPEVREGKAHAAYALIPIDYSLDKNS